VKASARFILELQHKVIFKVFGISVDAFRIGAGALLFLSAVSLMNPADKSVSKTLHGDRFVAAARQRTPRPLRVTYLIGKGCEHADISSADRKTLDDAIFSAF